MLRTGELLNLLKHRDEVLQEKAAAVIAIRIAGASGTRYHLSAECRSDPLCVCVYGCVWVYVCVSYVVAQSISIQLICLAYKQIASSDSATQTRPRRRSARLSSSSWAACATSWPCSARRRAPP